MMSQDNVTNEPSKGSPPQKAGRPISADVHGVVQSVAKWFFLDRQRTSSSKQEIKNIGDIIDDKVKCKYKLAMKTLKELELGEDKYTFFVNLLLQQIEVAGLDAKASIKPPPA